MESLFKSSALQGTLRDKAEIPVNNIFLANHQFYPNSVNYGDLEQGRLHDNNDDSSSSSMNDNRKSFSHNFSQLRTEKLRKGGNQLYCITDAGITQSTTKPNKKRNFADFSIQQQQSRGLAINFQDMHQTPQQKSSFQIQTLIF